MSESAEDFMPEIVVEPPKFIQIAVTNDGELFALDSHGDIYRRVVKMSGEFWQKIQAKRKTQ